MAILSQLDVVNACLSTMGESPLIALDNDHPYVPAALQALENASTVEQAGGYWFNTDQQNLTVDPTTGFIYTPADALDVDAGPYSLQRGRRLYDRTRSTYDMRLLFGNGPIAVVVVREIPFEDLPPLAQQVISYRAQLDFQQAYDGDEAKYSKIGGAYTNASKLLNAEDIRQQKSNMFGSRSMQRKLNQLQPMTRFANGLPWAGAITPPNYK
jgi:hypothetical protein